MFANAKALVVIVSCALIAQAQTTTAPSSQPTLSSCLVQCVTAAAASGGCSSFTDVQCVCTSTSFQQAAGQCIQTNCSAADMAAAQALQQQTCGALSSATGSTSSTSATGTSTGTKTETSTGTSTKASSTSSGESTSKESTSKASTATSSTTSHTQSATSSSAAMALSAPFSFGSFVGTLVASAGALVGAALVM